MQPAPLKTEGARLVLTNPTVMPRACSFLWNRTMMIQVNCRGFATAQHLQPEPAKYSHAPNLEAATFMQPEQPYYAHHPGRFVYVRDEEDGSLFSVPYEPVRRAADRFEFIAEPHRISWRIVQQDLEFSWSLSLPPDDAVELWSLSIRNHGNRRRQLSLYPSFTIGYMSWMNQSAVYRPDLGGIVASCVTPYQKVEDYERVRRLKDQTFLLHDTVPDAWETVLQTFEGEGGLQRPDAIGTGLLAGGEACYEMPAAVLQYRIDLEAGAAQEFRFLFGPARDDAGMAALRDRYLSKTGFETALEQYRAYLDAGRGCLVISTPDAALDDFTNHWLARQVYYHGDVNRLCTDPQTRNYLQDAMGLSFIQPQKARDAFLRALAQQQSNGAMPDGILLHPDAELKYINQVPHSDHCVWLPVCLQAWLNETGDYGFLDTPVASAQDGEISSVFERISCAMRWLLAERDQRGLNYIAQGDWCDPMNMAGHLGNGVSGWLSIATVYALRLWAEVCIAHGKDEMAREMHEGADGMAAAIQKYLWDGDWFARGITDAGVVFGVSDDHEGRIYLNPQSWAMMAGLATPERAGRMIHTVEQHLESPFGVEMLAPAYTAMREDVGRLTQKFPGSAENGSVYNHAAAFYVFGLYSIRQPDHAWRVLRKMLPGPAEEDLLQRGQLPLFIPNYYRGAWRQYPNTAGRSSQLFNTGTASWFYRILIEELFGLKGCREGLRIDPQLPSQWNEASVTRKFRGARFEVRYRRESPGEGMRIQVDGENLAGNVIRHFETSSTCRVEVILGVAAP
jgi:cellobionic acid phosphorylase